MVPAGMWWGACCHAWDRPHYGGRYGGTVASSGGAPQPGTTTPPHPIHALCAQPVLRTLAGPALAVIGLLSGLVHDPWWLQEDQQCAPLPHGTQSADRRTQRPLLDSLNVRLLSTCCVRPQGLGEEVGGLASGVRRARNLVTSGDEPPSGPQVMLGRGMGRRPLSPRCSPRGKGAGADPSGPCPPPRLPARTPIPRPPARAPQTCRAPRSARHRPHAPPEARGRSQQRRHSRRRRVGPRSGRAARRAACADDRRRRERLVRAARGPPGGGVRTGRGAPTWGEEPRMGADPGGGIPLGVGAPTWVGNVPGHGVGLRR